MRRRSTALSPTARVWVLNAVLAVVGAAGILLIVLSREPSAPGFRIPWIVIAVGTFLSEATVLHVRYRGEAMSVSMAEIPLIVGLFFLTPQDLALATMVGSAAGFLLYRRQVPMKAAFNLATTMIELTIMVGLFYALAPPELAGPAAWVAAGIAALVAGAATSALVTVAISFVTEDWSASRFWADLQLASAATLADTCLGLLIVELGQHRPIGLVLILVPGLIVYMAYRSLVAQDETRRRAQEAIAASREQLQAILDNSPSLVFIKDAQGAYELVNRRFEEVHGLEPGAALGVTSHALFGEKIGERLASHDRQVLESRQAVFFEEAVPDASGTNRIYLSVKFPIRSAAGELSVCGLATDITERRHLEARLNQAQKMEAVGHLAGGIAHDFNNLLAVMRNYAEFVALEVSGPVADDVKEIVRAADKAADLTRQLLTFSRRDLARPIVLDVNAGVSEMHKLLSRTVGENIQLSTSLAPDLGRIKLDRGQLDQILMNLAVNARDAMPSGGSLTIVTRNVAAADAPADLEPRDYIVVEVSDTGVGMSPEVLANIFDPFFTTKGRGEGTGLGLATVYGIVQNAGGAVTVESAPGQGSAFRVYLPITHEQPGGSPEQTPSMPAGRGATILVTEDEAAVRRLVERILKGSGYEVLSAGSAEEALELLSTLQRPVDLLLTDVILPNLSGPELARISGLSTVFMSGYSERLFADGVVPDDVRFVQKPFTSQDLLREVAGALAS